MKIGDKIKAIAGRNKGKFGTIKAIKENHVYLDFGGYIMIDEDGCSFTRYPDAYWMKL